MKHDVRGRDGRAPATRIARPSVRPGLLGVFVALAFVAAPVAAFDIQEDIIQVAQSRVGDDYCWAGTGPSCFDCSGFVVYLYGDWVPGLPHSSSAQQRMATPVALSDIRPGDLLFYATMGDPNRTTHVAVYVGANSMIHSISDGPNRGISVTLLSANYWRTRFNGAGRILPSSLVQSSSAPAVTDEPIQYANGRYEGELVGGEPSGNGVLTLNNGDRYEGRFSDGAPAGQGTYTWSDGETYRGNIRNSRRSTYFETARSPWDDYDGLVRGDFAEFLDQEQSDFEAWKQQNEPR